MAALCSSFLPKSRFLFQRNSGDYQNGIVIEGIVSLFYRIGKLGFSRKLGLKSGWCCCSSRGDSGILKFAVSGATELLRIFNRGKDGSTGIANEDSGEGILIRYVDDVVSIIESDYQRAYFLTGDFTSTVYDEDCLFEDPTIKFRGRDLYRRNLKLLVPFFDQPSLVLKEIMKCSDGGTKSIKASWNLRTYLNFPWRPLISIEGATIYNLNEELKIIRHAETWNVSPIEAISQIFRPSNLRHKG